MWGMAKKIPQPMTYNNKEQAVKKYADLEQIIAKLHNKTLAVLSLTFIVIGNGIIDPSSNPGQGYWHSTSCSCPSWKAWIDFFLMISPKVIEQYFYLRQSPDSLSCHLFSKSTWWHPVTMQSYICDIYEIIIKNYKSIYMKL